MKLGIKENGFLALASEMEEDSKSGLTVLYTRGTGKTIKQTAKVVSFMLTVTSMKVTGRTIRLTDTESTCMQTAQGMKESGKKTSSMEKE